MWRGIFFLYSKIWGEVGTKQGRREKERRRWRWADPTDSVIWLAIDVGEAVTGRRKLKREKRRSKGPCCAVAGGQRVASTPPAHDAAALDHPHRIRYAAYCRTAGAARAETAAAGTRNVRNVCAKRVRTLFLGTRIADAGARGGSEREREQERESSTSAGPTCSIN
jgi:hypothetical protein